MTCLLGSLLKRSRIGLPLACAASCRDTAAARTAPALRPAFPAARPTARRRSPCGRSRPPRPCRPAAARAWRSAPVRGSKLQICLSRITSSKTCCTVIVSPRALSWIDAFLLGQVVGGALGRRQLQVDVADDLGRHVGGHVFLDAAQDAVAASARQQLARGVSGGMRSGSTKAKMLTRSSMRFSIGVPVIAQLRSRVQAAHHLGRLRFAVLDALRLVEHDHVEVDAARRRPRRRRASAARS